MNWKRILTALIIVLLVAYYGYSRARNLPARGLLEHDEGHALLNANTWHHVLRWGLEGGPFRSNPTALATLRDELHREGGTLYSAGKFGYSLLLAVVTLPWQVTTNEALMLAWLAGILVCVMAGVLTWQYSGSRNAGFLAFVLSALSPLLLTLSREASGTIWALLFAMSGLACLQWSASFAARKRWALGLFGGTLLGYAFTCHFNIAPFILGSFLAGGLFCVQKWQRDNETNRFKLFLKAVTPAAVGSLAVLALFEIATQIVDYRLRNVFPEYRSFFGELYHLFVRDQVPMLGGVLYGDGVIGWGAEAWLYYGRTILREGILAFLIPVSIIYMLIFERNGRSHLWAPLILFGIPVVFYAAYVYRVERALGMCLAAGYILIPVAIGRANTEYSDQKINLSWLLLLMFVLNLNGLLIRNYVKTLKELHSPIPAVVDTTLTDATKNGGLITAGSFDTGFAPLWKWAIVEAARQPDHAAARQYIDFSRFDGATIVFTDPNTWRRPSPEFSFTRQQVQAGTVLAKEESERPAWTVASHRVPEGSTAQR